MPFNLSVSICGVNMRAAVFVTILDDYQSNAGWLAAAWASRPPPLSPNGPTCLHVYTIIQDHRLLPRGGVDGLLWASAMHSQPSIAGRAVSARSPACCRLSQSTYGGLVVQGCRWRDGLDSSIRISTQPRI